MSEAIFHEISRIADKLDGLHRHADRYVIPVHPRAALVIRVAIIKDRWRKMHGNKLAKRD